MSELVERDALGLPDHQLTAMNDRHSIRSGGANGGLCEHHGLLLADADERNAGGDFAMAGAHLEPFSALILGGELLFMEFWPMREGGFDDAEEAPMLLEAARRFHLMTACRTSAHYSYPNIVQSKFL